MQGAQAGALWQPRGVRCGEGWEGGSRGRGHMYTYDWFMLMYGRNQHNILKQLPPIKKKKQNWWINFKMPPNYACLHPMSRFWLLPFWLTHLDKRSRHVGEVHVAKYWALPSVKRQLDMEDLSLTGHEELKSCQQPHGLEKQILLQLSFQIRPQLWLVLDWNFIKDPEVEDPAKLCSISDPLKLCNNKCTLF